MSDFNFKKWNNILGWLCFTIAVIVYGITAEPTVSFWDSGEYILTASKLQVGHPPGAPFFQMLGAFFSNFATEPSQIGYIMNLMSGVASAFTVLFMFWSISILLSKLSVRFNSKIDNSFTILLSSCIASLSFMFTDTFWFNAVETEVYAMATLIMALLFYLGLRWEQEMHLPRGNRWLILISFVVGLSFGVHFMGLLTIPAIGLIYFFKNYKPITIKKFIIANIAVVAILMFVFKLLAPNILLYFSMLEVFFVNDIGLPFNSGTIIAGILLISFFYYVITYTIKNNLKTLNTITLCVMFILIGFSSWIMLPIRANADVVVNENDPSNARELLAYYNLEQYPKTQLFYGPLFTDQYVGLDKDESKRYKDDNPKYEKDTITKKYKIVNDYKEAVQNFNSEQASILPRMWSTEHAVNYLRYTGLLNYDINSDTEDRLSAEDLKAINDFKQKMYQGGVNYEMQHEFFKKYGQYLNIEKPSIISNVTYLIQYQLGYMYWRYFMWNFSGRQDDIQGRMDMHGNWISGINFLDEIHLGLSQDNLPSDVTNNKSRNKYYMIPFLIGLIGLYFLYNRDKELFWTMLVFFIFTGIAIQVYTNVRPFEPRERDYSVVGSFYVFSMWIGFGVFSITSYLNKLVNPRLIKILSLPIFILILPINLAFSNWDDHDRSGRYTAYSMAVKYLESCEPNSILFTIGDNDTFPLWYAQEIEGIRTDVRVLNTSLFATDWYIDQMKRKAYDSEPIPSSLMHDKYKYGTRDYIINIAEDSDTLNIKEFINNVTSDEPEDLNRHVLKKEFKEQLIDYEKQIIFQKLVEKEMGNLSIVENLTEKQYTIIQEKAVNKAIVFMSQNEIELENGILKKININVDKKWKQQSQRYRNQELNFNYFSSGIISIPVDKDSVIKNKIVDSSLTDQIVDEIIINIKSRGLRKNRLLMLDIIAENNWKRPIYFTGGSWGDEDFLWMKDYLQLEGLCYKLVPIKTPVDKSNPYEIGRVNTEKMYNLVKDWDWGADNMDVYFDVESRKNSISYRNNISRLINELILENKKDKAEEMTNIVIENMPVSVFGYYSTLHPYVEFYYKLGNKENARKLFDEISNKYKQNLVYYSNLTDLNKKKYVREIYTDIEKYRSLVLLILSDDEDIFIEKNIKDFIDTVKMFSEISDSDFLDPFVQVYYEVNQTENARELFEEISAKIKGDLSLIFEIDDEYLYNNGEELKKALDKYLQRYRSMLETLQYYEDQSYIINKMNEYNEFVSFLNVKFRS